jgi:quercetin dioxygenase-like cupin family protein
MAMAKVRWTRPEEESMSMNRRQFIVTATSAAVVLTTARTSGAFARQDATPQPVEATFEPLATALIEQLPPAPAAIGLARITYEPGLSGGRGYVPGPQVWAVEEGELTISIGGDVSTPAADGTPVAASEVTLQAGDQAFVPAFTEREVTNAGNEPVTVLTVWMTPGDTFSAPAQDQIPQGITLEVLSSGVAQTLPDQPVALTLARGIFEPGYELPPGAPTHAPVLTYIEEGELGYTISSGESEFTFADTDDATPAAVDPAATPVASIPGQEVILRAGDSLFTQTGAVESARNAGEGQLIALYVIMPLATGAEATPAT